MAAKFCMEKCTNQKEKKKSEKLEKKIVILSAT